MAGMSLAVAVVVLGSSSADSIERMRDVRFQAEQREDLTVSLGHTRAIGTARDFLGLPGVKRVEPYRAVPARLVAPGRSQDVTIFGLQSGSVLRKAVSNGYGVVQVPDEGAVVGAWLAKQFKLHRGDMIPLEIRENRRRVATTRVVDIIDEPLGVAAYMDLDALGRLLGEPSTYSAASLVADPRQARELYAVLKRMPLAVAVDFRRGALASYREMSDSAVNFVRKIEVLFAVVIAFGVVYNSAKIALAERTRELATLRVLGMTRREISGILLGEVGVLAAVAVPIGFAVGNAFAALVARAMSTQRMHVPHVVAPATFGFAFAVFAVAATVSALVVRRGLDHLDLVAVLKARE
jgi:putative ABC transport system permease protein